MVHTNTNYLHTNMNKTSFIANIIQLLLFPCDVYIYKKNP